MFGDIAPRLLSGKALVDRRTINPRFKPPILSDFSWVNKRSGVTALTALPGGGFTLQNVEATNGVVELSMLTIPVPAQPYTVTLCFQPSMFAIANVACGLFWSGSGGIDTVEFTNNTVIGRSYNSATSYDAGYQAASTLQAGGGPTWAQLIDDGTYRYAKLGMDGYTWYTWVKRSRTAFINAPTKLGIYVWSGAASGSTFYASMSLLSWSVTSP